MSGMASWGRSWLDSNANALARYEGKVLQVFEIGSLKAAASVRELELNCRIFLSAKSRRAFFLHHAADGTT